MKRLRFAMELLVSRRDVKRFARAVKHRRRRKRGGWLRTPHFMTPHVGLGGASLHAGRASRRPGPPGEGPVFHCESALEGAAPPARSGAARVERSPADLD